MKLLPNLSKVPAWMSLSLIASSPLVFYLLASRPVDSLTMDDISPGNLINRAVAQVAPPPLPLPVPNQVPPVGQYEPYQSGNPCMPPPRIANRAPAPVPQSVARRQGTRTYWAGSERVLKDPRAITLLNLAPGTKRSTIANAVGMGSWDGDSYVWETRDGMIRANFTAANRLNDDQLEWMGLQ